MKFRPLDYHRDWQWVQINLPIAWTSDTKGIVAENEEGERLGAAICDQWTWTSVTVHQIILAPMILRHGFFEEVAEYVYVHADRAIMYGLVPSDNKRALKLNKNIGFTEVARLKDAVNFGIDMVILELRKNDCRFLSDELKDAEFTDSELEEA